MFKLLGIVWWLSTVAVSVTVGDTTYDDRRLGGNREPNYEDAYYPPDTICLEGHDPNRSGDVVRCNCTFSNKEYPYCTTLSGHEWTQKPWKGKEIWDYCVCSSRCEKDSDCPPAPKDGNARAYCCHGNCLLGCANFKQCPEGMHCRLSASHKWTIDCYYDNKWW